MAEPLCDSGLVTALASHILPTWTISGALSALISLYDIAFEWTSSQRLEGSIFTRKSRSGSDSECEVVQPDHPGKATRDYCLPSGQLESECLFSDTILWLLSTSTAAVLSKVTAAAALAAVLDPASSRESGFPSYTLIKCWGELLG